MTATRVPHETFAGYTTLETMVCPMCGVMYAVPERLLEKARTDPRREWFCANGHNLHYPGKTEEQRIKALKDEVARQKAIRDQTEASLRATRGVVTRQRKRLERVAKGVCPCCNRSFTDVRKHMKSKHPEWDGGVG